MARGGVTDRALKQTRVRTGRLEASPPSTTIYIFPRTSHHSSRFAMLVDHEMYEHDVLGGVIRLFEDQEMGLPREGRWAAARAGVPACQRAGRRGEGEAKAGSAGQSPRAGRQGLPAAALRDADEVVPRRQDGPALRLRRGGGETCPVHKASTARSGGSTRADAYLVGVTFPPEKGSPRTSRPGILNCVNSCHAS